MKKSTFVAYCNSLVGQWIDVDGYYGAQCVDLAMHVCEKFWGYRTFGNAIDYTSNKLPSGFTRYSKGQTSPQAGDILVWKWGSWDVYGHIGVCVAVNGRNITSVEQNVDGSNLTRGGVARLRTRTDDCLVAILRPPFEAEADYTASSYVLKPERAAFTLTVDSINVRTAPNTKATIRAKYEKGQTVYYDSYCICDGYVWISYVSYSGVRSFMAIGEWNGYRRTSVWGTFR